jgi:hypothetical protein
MKFRFDEKEERTPTGRRSERLTEGGQVVGLSLVTLLRLKGVVICTFFFYF